MNFVISKSDYTTFLNCPKALWMKYHQREKAKQLSAFEELKIREGNEVGRIAQKHPSFKNNILIHTLNTELALVQTQAALNDPNIETIFEAAFSADISGVKTLVRCDVIQKEKTGLKLTEVKSSTKLKDKYLQDIAFQVAVIEASGKALSSVNLFLVNKEYTLGEQLDIQCYFINEEVSILLPQFSSPIKENLIQIKNILEVTEEFNYPTGTHCTQPFVCTFSQCCEATFSLDSVENLRNLHYKKRDMFAELKISKMSEIPDEVLFQLTETQQLQVLCAKKPDFFHFELEHISKCLSQLVYPYHFLDFESLLSAIPYFSGMKPHRFATYQASIHKRSSATHKITHAAFLETTKANPHLGLMSFLKQNISSQGSIIVYHQQFEKARLEDLKKEFPQKSELIDSWISRLWDLENIFKNFWFYSHEQAGSTSLKKVLPVVVPSLSYKNLNIQNGNDSVSEFLRMLDATSSEEKENIAKHLSAYNNLDTFCMVKIIDKIHWLCKKETSKIPA